MMLLHLCRSKLGLIKNITNLLCFFSDFFFLPPNASVSVGAVLTKTSGEFLVSVQNKLSYR